MEYLPHADREPPALLEKLWQRSGIGHPAPSGAVSSVTAAPTRPKPLRDVDLPVHCSIGSSRGEQGGAAGHAERHRDVGSLKQHGAVSKALQVGGVHVCIPVRRHFGAHVVDGDHQNVVVVLVVGVGNNVSTLPRRCNWSSDSCGAP